MKKHRLSREEDKQHRFVFRDLHSNIILFFLRFRILIIFRSLVAEPFGVTNEEKKQNGTGLPSLIIKTIKQFTKLFFLLQYCLRHHEGHFYDARR